MTKRKWALLSGPMVVDVSGEHDRPGHGWPPPSICMFRDASMEQLHDAEANARLISAAPDLLEALRSLTDWAREHTSPNDANSPHDLLVAAIAAITRAEG